MSLSDIKYELGDLNPDHVVNKSVVGANEVQKVALKLQAVSDNKYKLIGIVYYEFNPTVYKFETLNRKILTFQKSIDKLANITFSAKLEPIKVYNQSDYESTI